MRKSNPFMTAKFSSKVFGSQKDYEIDLERRSEGERFKTQNKNNKKNAPTSAYHEFVKVNDLFS